MAHVEELEAQRRDLESALAELEGLIKETDRRIRESFEQTFEAAAQELRGRGAAPVPGRPRPAAARARRAGPAAGDRRRGRPRRPRARSRGDEEEQPEAGVEIEVTPPGKSTKRLSLLSGGEKSLVALAFMFAVFLARPCPFYILDEVEAALDDINIDRFLQLVRRYSDRAQFIVVTHQKRTMDAADTLYGVSMGGDGVSRVISRRLERRRDRRRGRRLGCRRVARTWHELFVTGEDAPAARAEAEERARAPRLLPPPAREHVEDARGARRRAAGDGLPVARRRGLRAPRGDADLRRRRRADHRGDRRAARARGGVGRADRRRGPHAPAARAARRDRARWTATRSS